MLIPAGKLEKVPRAEHSSQELLPAKNPPTHPKNQPHLHADHPPKVICHTDWPYEHLRKPLRSKSVDPSQRPNLPIFALHEAASLQELRCAAECSHASDALSGSERFRSPRPPNPHLHTFHKQKIYKYAKHTEKKCTQVLSPPFQKESEPVGVYGVPGAHLADVWVRRGD